MDVPSHISEAHHMLRALSELALFEMLAKTPSATYFGGLSPALGELSLEELVELSPATLHAMGLTPGDTELLSGRIAALIPGSDLQSPVSDHTTDSSRHDHESHGSETVLSSVVVEKMLTEKLTELSGSGALEVFGAKQLREFWPQGAVSAPFEEELTFKQLAKMSARALLSKRSVSSEKVQAICAAVSKMLSNFSRRSETSSAPTPTKPITVERQSDGSDRSYVAMLEAELSLTKRLLAVALDALPARTKGRVMSGILTGEQKPVLRTKRRPVQVKLTAKSKQLSRKKGVSAKKGTKPSKRGKTTSRRWN